ncbi:histidine phosphatase family protein [Paenibacillus sp. RC67]|uniref:histidine phosphatase family protein n=1 Tax=Paenibacillus sp. RC67 TaxID=3039392 RepID=UPI0024ADB49E|nr:histidine phosphatase family protein [Paenibacillus sp. RC67]
MKIFLVRHGEDESGYRGGWSSRGLVSNGISQSRKLAEYLHQNKDMFKINTIFSSDLNRAVETSRPIETMLNIQAGYFPHWREMNNGLLAGLANTEAERDFPGVYFNTLQMDEAFPGGESPIAFFQRVKSVFEEFCSQIERREVKSNVLIVTHGGFINVLYYLLNGLEWTNKSSFYPIGNASVHTIEKTDDGWEITESNDMKHLE